MRAIRKYKNRKLYDVEQSCYITLAELNQLVKSGVDIAVIDTKTKNNITDSVLLDIICLNIKARQMSTVDELAAIIRGQDPVQLGFNL